MTIPITFDDFVPGRLLGETDQVYRGALSAQWQQIFGAPQSEPERAAEAASIATVMMMRAYTTVVTPRPPGNVHARQQIALDGLPREGESIRTRVACLDKALRKERRYVELQLDGTGDGGRAIYRARMTLIWAR